MRTEIKLQIKTYCMCMCVFVSFVIGISFSIHYTLKYGVIVLQFCYLETCIHWGKHTCSNEFWNLYTPLKIYHRTKCKRQIHKVPYQEYITLVYSSTVNSEINASYDKISRNVRNMILYKYQIIFNIKF